MQLNRYTILFAFLGLTGHLGATTYYLSPTGNDTNNGTSSATAWRSISRLQQVAASLQPGDQVLFERGGTFPGQFTINSNGSSAQPIIIGSYGTGALPIVTGSVAVTGWTVHQGDIWRANVAGPVKYVHVGSELMTLARFPNTGWLRVNTASTTQLTSSGITQPSGHWNGAELVLRSTNWCYENAVVSSHTNNTLQFPAIVYNPGNYGWGFFLQNKLSELDSPGEWFHDATTGVLYFRAPGNADPNTINVRASVHENGIEVGWQKQYITIRDIEFRHHKHAGVYNTGANVTVTGCTFQRSYFGVRSYANNNSYTNNHVHHTYASGMGLLDNNSIVADNTVEDIALKPGLGETFWGYYGMYVSGSANTVRRNTITRTGNSALFLGGSPLVEKNLISHVLMTVNDGGGIYWDSADGATIQDNIISEVGGNIESVAMDYGINQPLGMGIYFGNSVIQNIIVRRNTVHDCSAAGIHVDHTMVSANLEVRDNVLYGNDIQLSITDQSNVNGPGATPPYHVANFNDVYSGNTLYCLSKEQRCVQQYHVHGTALTDFGTFTNNRYFNPYNELSIKVINTQGGYVKDYTLERWRAERNEEAGSTRSPRLENAEEVVARTSANMISNSSFDYNTNGWSGWPTQGQIQYQAGLLDNGALKVTYGSNAGSPEFYLRTDNMMNVQSGSWYELKFTIQSSTHGTVRADFKGQSQAATPNSIYARYIPFDTQRRDITLLFQSDLSEPGMMIFANHYSEPSYLLDNVELYKVTVQAVDPRTRHVLFTNPTDASADIPLTGCWRDVNGAVRSGSITLPAFGSIVLAREDDALCGLTTGLQDEMAQDGPATHLFPNPLVAGAPLFISEGLAADARVDIHDPSGRLVHAARMARGSTIVPLPDGIRSGNYVVSMTTGEVRTHHRIVIQ
ncbi:MAG: right-handed parallel beta-helix repeat-containing protein [Flavobacteriales bacterium]|nr:right-handed parallel beta-helix repeat-containing protein [Flavobacteriales bacterium]